MTVPPFTSAVRAPRAVASIVPIVALVAVTVAASTACTPAATPPASEPQPPAKPPEPAFRSGIQRGYATWYGGRLAGRRMASGEVFDPRAMTAAHRTLPLGTWVEVTCIATGRRVRVRITDRGPFGRADRIIDLSRAAADQLGIRARGIALVALHVVDGP